MRVEPLSCQMDEDNDLKGREIPELQMLSWRLAESWMGLAPIGRSITIVDGRDARPIIREDSEGTLLGEPLGGQHAANCRAAEVTDLVFSFRVSQHCCQWTARPETLH